MNKYNFFNHFR